MPKAPKAAKAAAPADDQLRADIVRIGGALADDALAPPEDDPFPNHLSPGQSKLTHAQLRPSPLNPRKHFDEAAIAELADSIAAHGLLQNLVVRPIAGEPFAYWIVAGESRWRAVALAITQNRWALDALLPVEVRHLTDAEHAALSLVENLQRKDLKPLEEAEAFKAYMDATGHGTAELAAKIGFGQRMVQQRLQLLELDTSQKAQLNRGTLTIEKARQVLAQRPKPLPEMEPAERLIFLEVAYRVACGKRFNFWDQLRIGAGSEFDISEDSPWAQVGVEYSSAYRQIQLRYAARRRLLELTGSEELVRDKVEPVLRFARANFGHDHDDLVLRKAYATAWLNEPYDRDLVRLEAIKEEQKRERERVNAAQREANEKAAAEIEGRRADGEFLMAVRSLEHDAARGLSGAPIQEGFAAALKAGGFVGPLAMRMVSVNPGQKPEWTACDAQENVLAARGPRLEAIRRLYCLATNLALGARPEPFDLEATHAETRAWIAGEDPAPLDDEDDDAPERTCRLCGCTDDEPCGDAGDPEWVCSWVEDDLCSACVKQNAAAIPPDTGDGQAGEAGSAASAPAEPTGPLAGMLSDDFARNLREAAKEEEPTQ